MATQVSHVTIETKLLQWFLFSVCLGLSSIALKWLFLEVASPPARLGEILAEGELLIVGVAIAGAALSDIVVAQSRHVIRQFATFLCVVCLLGGSALYGLRQQASIHPPLSTKKTTDVTHIEPNSASPRTYVVRLASPAPEDPIVWPSKLLFGASVLIGGAALVLKET